MAVFGIFKALPFGGVLLLLGRRNGILELSLKGRSLTLHLQEGRLRALLVNQQPLTELAAVRKTLTELRAIQTGHFEFIKADAADLLHHFDLPLEAYRDPTTGFSRRYDSAFRQGSERLG